MKPKKKKDSRKKKPARARKKKAVKARKPARAKKPSKAIVALEANVKELEEKLYLEKHGGKLSLVPGVMNTKQILTIFQRTPKEHVFTRKGKGGGEFEYVTGTYVKKVLNYVFGFDWDFEVLKEEKDDLKVNAPQARVLGKLTVRNKDGKAVIKTQFGRADIKFFKGTKNPVDIGNDMKAAATDALKKCAAELGIASDIYGRNEFREVKPEIVEVKEEPPKDEVGIWEEIAEAMKIARKYGAKTDKEFVTFVNRNCKTKIREVRTTRSVAKAVLVELLAREGGKK